METRRCQECEFLKSRRSSPFAQRIEYRCDHPDQEYINNFCKEKKIQSDPGFLGWSTTYSTELGRKRRPKWCPKEK